MFSFKGVNGQGLIIKAEVKSYEKCGHGGKLRV